MTNAAHARTRRRTKARVGGHRGPTIVGGNPLIEGSERLIFPAFYRERIEPVTFREGDALRCREEREEYAFGWFERVRKKPHLALILIPHDIYADPRHAIFQAGWTLEERDGEIRTFQCVAFLAGAPVPVGRADQGVLCVARRDELTAWNGLTDAQTLLRSA